MKANRNLIYITSFITVLSAVLAMINHYNPFRICEVESDFWCNVALALFGSGLLTLISAIEGYLESRRRVLENFSYQTRQILHEINKYELNWGREQKIDFFLDYQERDFTAWDSSVGEIWFLIDWRRKNFGYIYSNIYKPILDLNMAIASHWYHFRWHKDGSGKNDVVMDRFIKEIEDRFIEEKISDVNMEGEQIQFTTIKKYLVENIRSELNGKYYDIMYLKSDERGEAK